jgi:hypothetical protein
MFWEFDSSYWSKYEQDISNPSMSHLSMCRGMIDLIKSLPIWESSEYDLPMRSQYRDGNGDLCDREFTCGLTEDEWDYVGNVLVTLPNYPTPLFFFCAYPISRTTSSYSYNNGKPLVFMSFGLNNFERYSRLEKNFDIDKNIDVVVDYDPANAPFYAGDLVIADGEIYRCLVDGCGGCKPWENRNHWLPQFEEFDSTYGGDLKIYTAGFINNDTNSNDVVYDKVKKVVNWEISPRDIVYSWRVQDTPYAKGTIVEYNGLRYKNVCDNVGGCYSKPVPYNFTVPYGSSGHWLPEFFYDNPYFVESPILPVFMSEHRDYNGRKNMKFIVSFLYDTLTFIDCLRCINERGKANPFFNQTYRELSGGNTISRGYPFISIAPGTDNNLDSRVLCDYFVFGGHWVASKKWSFTIKRSEAVDNVINHRPDLPASVPNPPCTIINNLSKAISASGANITGDITHCALVNASIDSKDGVVDVDKFKELGLKLHSDYARRMNFASSMVYKTVGKLLNPKSDYRHLVTHKTFIRPRTNYTGAHNGDEKGLVGLKGVYYDPLFFRQNVNSDNYLNSSSIAYSHISSADRSQLNGTVYFLPIWMYLLREPVVLKTISTAYRSKVLFGCDMVYNSDVDKLVVNGKTYLAFKFLNSSDGGGAYGDIGVALLVDDREAD